MKTNLVAKDEGKMKNALSAKKCSMPIIYLFSFIALAISGCNTSKVIFRESSTKNDYMEIRSVNYAHCGCAHIYADKFDSGRRLFLLTYSNDGTTKSIYRNNASGSISDTVLLKGVSTNEFTIPLDSVDIIIYNSIDSFVQRKPPAPIYKLERPNIKGYVRM